MKAGSKLDGYIRVSRVAGREGPSYISPSVQREQIERWASYKGVSIGQWHVDEDWSGGASSRPGLDLAVERAVSGQTGGIVSARIDRFSRMTEHGLRDLRRLNEAGARLAFVAEDIDTSSAAGKLVYTIMLAQAEYLLDQIKAQWVAAKTRAVARGAFIGPTPLGYRRREDGTLEPDPKLAPIISEAYRLAAGRNLGDAAAYLRATLPDRRWNMATLRRVLASRVYLGETRNGDMVQPDTHIPLVSRSVWEAAQSSPREKSAPAAFPLTGLARCATCEGPMIAGRGGTGQRTYRCSNTRSAQVRTELQCPQGATIVADRLESYVREQVAGLPRPRVVVSDPDSDRLVLLERAIEEAQAELDAFASDLTLRRVLKDRYHQHLQERADALDAATSEYRRAAREATEAESFHALDPDDPQAFAAMLRGLFSAIIVRPGRGLRVEEKVRLVPLDPHGPAGVAGLEEA